jgi:uncharacterized protein
MLHNFLSAEWRKLALANYEVPTELLQPYLPHKTHLDLWQNTCYVSLVGFMFCNTRLKGIKIPFHTNFEEVNLRFYVKYLDEKTGWKRGVTFIKEIVPKPAITWVARTLYGEPYETMPMKHSWQTSQNQMLTEYEWKTKKPTKWHSIQLKTSAKAVEMLPESEEEFITEHFWGYTKRSNTKTSEYGVEHPRWLV